MFDFYYEGLFVLCILYPILYGFYKDYLVKELITQDPKMHKSEVKDAIVSLTMLSIILVLAWPISLLLAFIAVFVWYVLYKIVWCKLYKIGTNLRVKLNARNLK